MSTSPSILMWNRLGSLARNHDLKDLLTAEVRDPAWLLCRQWQLGEFKGEDAAMPTYADIRYRRESPTGLTGQAGNSEPMPHNTPLDSLVEAVAPPLDLSLRIEIGLHWIKLLQTAYPYNDQAEVIAAFRETPLLQFEVPSLSTPEANYEMADQLARSEAINVLAMAQLRGAIDGGKLLALLQQPISVVEQVLQRPNQTVEQLLEELIAWSERTYGIRQQPNPYWEAAELEYRFDLEAEYAAAKLSNEAYRGDHLHWYQFDLEQEASVQNVTNHVLRVRPTEVDYIGMPRTRWWEMEDSEVNYGNITTDTTNPARLLFAQFNLIYGNDWWLLPLPVFCGTLVKIAQIEVSDNFGFRTLVGPTLSGASQHWDFFNLHDKGAGSGRESWFYYPLAFLDVQKALPTEEVYLMRDEMANMVWAIEEVVPDQISKGTDGATRANELAAYIQSLRIAPAPVNPGDEEIEAAKYHYQLATAVPEHWIPFVALAHPNRQLGQTILQRASMPRIVEGLPPQRIRPQTLLMSEGFTSQGVTPFQIEEREVPRAGLQLLGQWRRTRGLDGQVHIWYARQKRVGRGDGRSNLAFDKLKER